MKESIAIRVIRERVDENGTPDLNPYTGRPKINGGSILLPSLDKLFPGETGEVPLEVAKGLLRDNPHMVMLEADYQKRLQTIRRNQARHNQQSRDDIRQAMSGSQRDREAQARMEQLIIERDRKAAEQRDALAESKRSEQAKQGEADKLAQSVAVLMAKLEERERRDEENAARLAQVQAELEEAKAKLSNPEKPKPEPEKPSDPKTDKGAKKA